MTVVSLPSSAVIDATLSRRLGPRTKDAYIGLGRRRSVELRPLNEAATMSVHGKMAERNPDSV